MTFNYEKTTLTIFFSNISFPNSLNFYNFNYCY